jgi:pimeloyl-ACP methyl ester carboxylesterase
MRWILLRGWAREARHWGEFPRALQAAFPRAEVGALDLPGNGSRCRERSPARLGDMVDDLRKSVRADGASKLHLLGLSLGAMACVDWACRFPREVAACVLINTSLRPFSGFHERLRPANYARILKLLFITDAARREAGILALTSSLVTGNLAQTWALYAQERPVSKTNALRQLIAAARFRAPEKAPAVPVLVLASASDRLVDPRCSEALARRWGVPLLLHPRAGHDLTLDDGPWVAAQVKRWLRGLQ